MATFVLVHGASHGAWCYSRVADRLRAHGHTVYVPTLTGVGERAHLATPAVNLSTHIDDVAAVLQELDLEHVILCGHSYGGMVITGVADRMPERIRALVYVDGCLAEDGQSLLDLVGPERAERIVTSCAGGTMAPAPTAEFFLVNAHDAAWVDSLTTPHPLACFTEKMRLTGKHEHVSDRVFVLCASYKSINHATCERVKDLPGWKAVVLDCGHDAMVDDPNGLTAILLESARG